MKYLTTLLPAEALLLTEGNACSLPTLLKAGFLHLLLRQVIKTEHCDAGQSATPADSPNPCITTGKNYTTIKTKPAEDIMLTLFDNGQHNGRFLFRHLVKVAYRKAVTPGRYRRLVMLDGAVAGFFSQHLLQRLTGTFSLSAEGGVVREQLKQELRDTEQLINNCIDTDPERVTATLDAIKGNVLLLKNVDLDRLLPAALQFAALQMKPGDEAALSATGCTGCSTWHSYNEYSDGFDSGGSGHGGSDGGGCGGDSGCSSGCGGCGGGGD